MGGAGRKVAAAAATGVLLAAVAACGSGSSGHSGDAAKGAPVVSASPGATAEAAAGSAATTPAPGDGSAAPAGTPEAATVGGAAAGATAPGPSAGAGASAGGPSGTAAGATPGGTSGGGGATAGATAGTTAGGATAGGGQPAAGPDSDTPLLDSALVAQLLPDQKAMTGWEEEKRRVDTADHATTCSIAAPCTGRPLSGQARFSAGETTVRFGVDTLPNRAQAQDRLKEAYASYGDTTKYGPADIGPLGTESRAFQGQLAGRDGVAIVLRSGTLVATVTTEGGPVDLAGTRRLAAMLVKRIEQAQAGRTPDAGLDPA
ncbi:hypothetical protein ACFVVU_26320 [Kitasatospora sp. NPDC057965]|uniref:hypothetical protein n=1 Tax=Kitasatospora sp. NPDC057965 TaxID=3346291 RepID=UPI0036DAC0D1